MPESARLFGTAHWRKKLRPFILRRDGYRCQIRIPGVCEGIGGNRLAKQRLEVDHIKPRAVGGTDDPANLRAACKSCNRNLASRAAFAPSREWAAG